MASYRVDFSKRLVFVDKDDYDLSMEIALEMDWNFLKGVFVEFVNSTLTNDPASLDHKILRKQSFHKYDIFTLSLFWIRKSNKA